MPSLDDVNNAIRGMVRIALEMPNGSVRPANPTSGVAAPVGPKEQQFSTVLVTQIGGTGWDSVTYVDDPTPGSTQVIETAQGNRLFTASVQFFRGDAFDKSERLRRRLQMSDMVSLCASAGIGISRLGQARNLTTVIDTFYEPRGQIDIDFCLIAQETINLQTFNTFPFTILSGGLTGSGEVKTS